MRNRYECETRLFCLQAKASAPRRGGGSSRKKARVHAGDARGLVGEESSQQQSQQQSQPSSSLPLELACHQCNQRLGVGYRFCPGCGAAQAAARTPTHA